MCLYAFNLFITIAVLYKLFLLLFFSMGAKYIYILQFKISNLFKSKCKHIEIYIK